MESKTIRDCNRLLNVLKVKLWESCSLLSANDKLANIGKGVSLQNYLNIGSIPILISTFLNLILSNNFVKDFLIIFVIEKVLTSCVK